MTLLSIANLTKCFPAGRDALGRTNRWYRAVDDVSFDVDPGQTLALVGESGAGKSTTGRLAMRLLEADEGSIHFDGADMRAMGRKDLRQLRQKMQLIHQDPHSALDPRVSIGESIGEPLRIHFGTPRKDRLRRAAELLERVSMGTGDLHRFPAELSGGQLQRVAIARALTLNPKLIVCDEPVAALDVSIRAQVINLMRDLQSELGLAYLFVSHDLALVEAIADRVAIMKGGKIVEVGSVERIYRRGEQTYTRELLAAVPVPIPRRLRQANDLSTGVAAPIGATSTSNREGSS